MRNPQLTSFSIVKTKNFSPKMNKNAIFSILVHIIGSSEQLGKKKENHASWKGEEAKWPLFSLQRYIKTLKIPINELEVEGYKNQHLKTRCILYMIDEQSEKEIKRTIPFIIALRIKYLRINQEVKDLYMENYKKKLVT